MILYMVELTVSDVARSAAWYAALGFVRTTHDPATGFTLLESPGGRVSLKPGVPSPAGVVLHFQSSPCPAGADTKISPEGYRRAKLTDPDGYMVVLFEWAGGG
jgi:catechol 2,3-dioxygenase-like lactoylglutathione lyase family enzyme